MFRQSGGEGEREGLFSALKNLLATLLAIGKTRAELLVTEIEEEKYRLVGLLVRALGVVVLFSLAVLLAVFAVASAFWEQRVWVFAIFALLFACVAVWLLQSVQRQASQPSKLFHASLAELETDMTQLRRRDGSAE